MYRFSIVAVGRLPAPLRAAADHYRRRLSQLAAVREIEVREAAGPSPETAAERERVRADESARVLRATPKGAFRVLVDPRGTMLASEALAAHLDRWGMAGRSDIAWLIGGSEGFSREMPEAVDFVWSLSPLTFPHSLARVIVYEQLYRALKILRGEPYHK
ncbi:MAG: 23S rRNA (pseudouridine(1915)-N(3))-methyltransferase RlmH [Hydrogenibacillus schlegelii]|uniref:Ribosomal RNA large subunit methyltransferase H n=1 Tax=Hydrogenibacillus schlegelii TaxID=1484 RepID=A0A947CWW4_HYDSH|nr:23S rRNA (pseudouridine(1915)-N(3))-methyltransferase RlmH [Hydrogenibacillus schlegelii]